MSLAITVLLLVGAHFLFRHMERRGWLPRDRARASRQSTAMVWKHSHSLSQTGGVQVAKWQPLPTADSY